MKPTRVQRDIGSRPRSVGDAPSIGRVHKMMGSSEQPGAPHPGRRGGSKKPASNLTKGWIIGVGVLSVALLVATFGFWTISRIKAAHGGERVDGLVIRSADPVAEPRLRLHPEEALLIAREAVGARTERAVEAHIHPGGSTTAEILRFLSELSVTDGEKGDFQLLQTLDTNGLRMQNLLVNYTGEDGKSSNRLVMLTPDPEDNWKMDFAAFARLTEPSWEKFLAAEADSITARVFVERDTYFNGVFADERQWACYAVASPDLPDLLFGYCARDSVVARALSGLAGGRGRGAAARVTVELQQVEGSERRQFEITRVLADDWVVREPYFDERVE